MGISIINSPGPVNMTLTIDRDGNRVYKLIQRAKTDNHLDGPFNVAAFAAGLPAVGSTWAFGNDVDPWAFCLPTRSVEPIQRKEGDKTFYWKITSTFSTNPQFRCQDQTIKDPLLEPQKVSGSFVKFTEEVARDKDDKPIQSSSHELFRGPQVEFDMNRPQVRIEQNVLDLQLPTVSQMIDTVNSTSMWGLGARRVKLSNFSWERKLYGICTFYFTRVFEFDINFNTFDRTIYDEGTRVLNGDWDENGNWVLTNINGAAPDPTNPRHFKRYKDRNGENTRAMLDGYGKPVTDGQNLHEIEIKYYKETDFSTLGLISNLNQAY